LRCKLAEQSAIAEQPAGFFQIGGRRTFQ